MLAYLKNLQNPCAEETLKQPTYICVSSYEVIRLRSFVISFQSMLAKLSVGEARSVAYNPDGEMIAVGLQNGEFMVLLANGLKLWGKRRDRAGSINDVR